MLFVTATPGNSLCVHSDKLGPATQGDTVAITEEREGLRAKAPFHIKGKKQGSEPYIHFFVCV